MRLRDIVAPREVYELAKKDIESINKGEGTIVHFDIEDSAEWAKMLAAISDEQAAGMFRMYAYIDEVLKRKAVV